MKKENPLANQSKQWLLAALLQLMQKKGFQTISIKELSKQADLDRKTFYRNFRMKEDILCLQMKTICEEYIIELKKLPQLSPFAISKAYFDLILRHIDFFVLLNQHNLLRLLLTKSEDYLPDLNELFVDNPTYRSMSPGEMIYQAGGFWNLTVYWIANGVNETPDEMAKIASAMISGS